MALIFVNKDNAGFVESMKVARIEPALEQDESGSYTKPAAEVHIEFEGGNAKITLDIETIREMLRNAEIAAE